MNKQIPRFFSLLKFRSTLSPRWEAPSSRGTELKNPVISGIVSHAFEMPYLGWDEQTTPTHPSVEGLLVELEYL